MDEGQQSAATPYSQAGGKYAQGATTPAQRHAGIFHSIMETLAGPQVRRKIVDPNTGQIIDDPTQPRRSTGQLANSIVAGALTGLFAGAGTSKMEGNLAAMGKGYNARQNQIQQQQQQAKQEATDALTRQQAMAEHNFRVHQLGVATANLDMDFNNKVNESGKQLHDEQEDNGMILQDHIREEDIPALMKKYNITKDMFMRSPEKSYPLVGPDGKPTNQVGNFYYVLKPGAKAHVTESDIADFNKAGIHDFDKVSPDQEVDIHALSLAKNRVNMLKAVGALGDSHKTAAGTGETSVVPSAPAAKITADTPIKGIDPNVVADTITKNEASTYKNNPGALKFANQPGATLGPNGFAIFATPEAGRQALLNDNAAKIKANPDMTISQLINKRTPVGAENTQAQVDTQVKNLIAAAQGAQAPAPTAKKKEVADEDLYSSKLAEAAKNGEISNEMLKVLTNFTLSREPLDAVKAMHANAVPEQYINKFVELHGGMDAMRKREDDYKLAQEKAKKESDTAAKYSPEAIAGEAKLAGAKEAAQTAAKLGADVAGAEGLSGDEFLAKLPTNEAAVVKQIANGQMTAKNMAYLLSRNTALAAHVAQYDPKFDNSKVEGYSQAVKEFESTKPNTAGSALNSGATALKHLNDLKKINDDNPIDARIPGTKAYNAYHNLLDTITGELAQFYQLPKTDNSIKSMASTLGSLANRDAAISRQALSMGEKFDSFEQQWKNAAPSPRYQTAMPNVDDAAKQARANLDPTYKARLDREKSGQPDTQQQGGNVAPDGTVVDVNGQKQIKQGGKWVPYQQGQ